MHRTLSLWFLLRRLWFLVKRLLSLVMGLWFLLRRLVGRSARKVLISPVQWPAGRLCGCRSDNIVIVISLGILIS